MTQQRAVWLGIATSCLFWSSTLSAQQTKPRLTFTGHTKSIWCVAISPDGKTIASGSDDDTIRFWDVASGKEQAKFIAGNYRGYDWPFPAESLAFSPNGKTLAAGIMGSGVKLIDVATHKDTMLCDNCVQCCGNTVLYSPDGRTLAVGNLCNPTVFLWNTASNKQTVVLKRDENQWGVKTMQFLHDSKSLLTLGQNYEIQIWDVATGKNTVALEPIHQQVD
jgi:WD40 repeat protein